MASATATQPTGESARSAATATTAAMSVSR